MNKDITESAYNEVIRELREVLLQASSYHNHRSGIPLQEIAKLLVDVFPPEELEAIFRGVHDELEEKQVEKLIG